MFTIHGPSHTHHHTTRLANTTTSQHPRPLVPPWTPWTRFVPRWPRGGGPLQWSRKQHQGRPGHQTAILSFVTNIKDHHRTDPENPRRPHFIPHGFLHRVSIPYTPPGAKALTQRELAPRWRRSAPCPAMTPGRSLPAMTPGRDNLRDLRRHNPLLTYLPKYSSRSWTSL